MKIQRSLTLQIGNRVNARKIVCRFVMIISILMIARQSVMSLTLDSCQILARKNYPLLRQYALIEKVKEYTVENAGKGFLPQLIIAGQATYQSEVTKVPISLPNMSIPELSKDQYKLYGEVSQPLTDLKTVSDQRNVVMTNATVEVQKVEVELYKLKERINNLYFGILLIDAQMKQNELLESDLQAGLNKINVAIANGTAISSNADLMKAELLKSRQRKIELKAMRKGYTDMLALFINQPVDDTTILEEPLSLVRTEGINRPELQLMDLQQKNIDAQNRLLSDRNLPKFSLFFQGGLGRPALNMLSNDIKGYYIGGVRLNWNLTSFYTYGKEKDILTANRSILDVQKDAFLFNTNLTIQQHRAEIGKLEELISTDKEIINLRENIKRSAAKQLENGTSTTTEYLTSVHAEDQARQQLILHQIQMIQTTYAYQFTTGNK